MKRFSNWFAVAACCILAAALIVSAQGPGSPNQALMRMRTIQDGVQTHGANVLQVGSVGTLSAAMTGSLTEAVPAPASGSTFLRAIWVEKAVGTTGAITIAYGTGTNCGTGTTTLMTLAANASNQIPLGNYEINVLVPATKALCGQTEAAGTQFRFITN